MGLKKLIEEKHPELIKAFKDYKKAVLTMESVIENLEDSYEV